MPQTYDLNLALNQLLTTPFAQLAFKDDEAKESETVDEKRSRLRDVLATATQDDLKLLDERAPEYGKAIIAEIRIRFEDEMHRVRGLKDVWAQTDGRGYFAAIGQTQEIITDLDDDLDRLLKKADDETIETQYLALKELTEKQEVKAT